jgi:hypothetical protein
MEICMYEVHTGPNARTVVLPRALAGIDRLFRMLFTAAVTMLVLAALVLIAPMARAQCTPGWSPGIGVPGINGIVNALVVMPNGDLVAGGQFSSAGGVAANGIARWNGASWSPLGAGVSGAVNALTVRPNGDLIAGGDFISAGGSPAFFIARWNGTAWAALGSGMDDAVTSLATLPNGDVVAGVTLRPRVESLPTTSRAGTGPPGRRWEWG